VANARADKKERDGGGESKPTAKHTPKFTLEFFVDDDGKHLVRDWLRSLSLTKKQVLGQAMNAVLQELGIGVCDTQFGKGGKKLPPEEILLRVFCHAHGDHIVLLLGGYDKGEDPSKEAAELRNGRSESPPQTLETAATRVRVLILWVLPIIVPVEVRSWQSARTTSTSS
jgi:hypothetical protein